MSLPAKLAMGIQIHESVFANTISSAFIDDKISVSDPVVWANHTVGIQKMQSTHNSTILIFLNCDR